MWPIGPNRGKKVKTPSTPVLERQPAKYEQRARKLTAMESALFEPVCRVDQPAGTLGYLIRWPSRVEQIVILDPDTREAELALR